MEEILSVRYARRIIGKEIFNSNLNEEKEKLCTKSTALVCKKCAILENDCKNHLEKKNSGDQIIK